MPMTTRYARTVAFQKHHGLPDTDISEPTEPLLSCPKKKTNQKRVIFGRKDEKYYSVSVKKKKTASSS